MTTTVETLKPTGMLDGTTTIELKNQVAELLSKGVNIILVDMEEVTFMNSSGIGALVATLKLVRAQGKELCLCGLSNQVNMIFELTKMDRVFKTYENREAFESSLMAT